MLVHQSLTQGEQMIKEAPRTYFSVKVTLRSKDGNFPCPFETMEEAQKEMDYYKDSKTVKAELEDWTDEDQAWWNEKKLACVANFGVKYLDDKLCLGMLKMFRPSSK